MYIQKNHQQKQVDNDGGKKIEKEQDPNINKNKLKQRSTLEKCFKGMI